MIGVDQITIVLNRKYILEDNKNHSMWSCNSFSVSYGFKRRVLLERAINV